MYWESVPTTTDMQLHVASILPLPSQELHIQYASKGAALQKALANSAYYYFLGGLDVIVLVICTAGTVGCAWCLDTADRNESL